MPVTISYTKISEFLELGKTKAESEFKESYFLLSSKKEDVARVRIELKKVTDKLVELAKILEKNSIQLAVPNQKQIEELTRKIGEHKFDQIVSAMKTRNGDLYALLEEKGRLVVANYNERDTIAKLLTLAYTFSSVERAGIIAALYDGRISTGLKLTVHMELVHRFFNRLGISCVLKDDTLFPGAEGVTETPVTIYSRRVWLPTDNALKVLDINKKLQVLSAKIQVQMTQNNVDLEIQHEYLKVLKDQDVLLEYNKLEESFFAENKL
ncbi:MAG: hypothetical protein ABII22_02890 [Candidatus Micrarchaeota archaeon]